MQLHEAYGTLGIRMWASEQEVRDAWSRQQQNPQFYLAAETIRKAGFPSAPPPGWQPPAPPPQAGYPVGPQPYNPGGQAMGGGYPVGSQPYGGAAPPQQMYGAPNQGAYPYAPPGGPQLAVEPAKVGGKQLLIGCALLLLGIVVTAGTHSAARHGGGGTYVIAYGPMVIGVITIFKGIFNLSMGK